MPDYTVTLTVGFATDDEPDLTDDEVMDRVIDSIFDAEDWWLKQGMEVVKDDPAPPTPHIGFTFGDGTDDDTLYNLFSGLIGYIVGIDGPEGQHDLHLTEVQFDPDGIVAIGHPVDEDGNIATEDIGVYATSVVIY